MQCDQISPRRQDWSRGLIQVDEVNLNWFFILTRSWFISLLNYTFREPPSISDGVEKGDPLLCQWKWKMTQSLEENSMEVPQKCKDKGGGCSSMVEHLSSMQIVVGSIPTTAKRNLKPYCHVIQPPHNGMHSTGLKAGSKKKCKLTCYSIVYSSLNLAGAQTSTDRSMREHHTASKYQKTLLDATLMNSKDFMQPKRDTQLQLYV